MRKEQREWVGYCLAGRPSQYAFSKAVFVGRGHPGLLTKFEILLPTHYEHLNKRALNLMCQSRTNSQHGGSSTKARRHESGLAGGVRRSFF